MLEAEVVGFAGTLGFWFALGLASPRLFLTQMSAIFKVKGGKKKEPNPGESLSVRAHPIAVPGGGVGRGGTGRAGTSSPRPSVLRDYAGGILASVTLKGAF